MASALMSRGLVLLLLQVVARYTTAVDVGDADAPSIRSTSRFQSPSDDVQSRELVLDKLRSKPFVLVTTANSTSADGVVAAVLSPRFLITMATWLTASASPSSPLFAVSTAQTISVKQVWLERNFSFSGDSSLNTSRSSPLAVIELERALDDLLAVELSTSLPAVESELDVVYLDPVLLRTSEVVKSYPGVVALSSDDCKQSMTSGGEFCVQSDLRQKPFKMGFATDSGRVIGIVTTAAAGTLADGRPVTSQSFLHLGSAPHRQFLDQVANKSLTWDAEKASASPTSSPSLTPSPTITPASSDAVSPPVGPVRVSFFGDDVSELNCGGVQIATDYILTSASCVLGHNVTHVAFQGGVFAANVPVASQVAHPSFESSDNGTTSAFDVAMLFTPSQRNPEPSVVLDANSAPAFSSLMRLQLGEPGQLQSVQLLPRAHCTKRTSVQSNATEGSGQQCIKAVPGNEDSTYLRVPIQSTNAALFRESAEVNFLIGLQSDTTSSDRFLLVAKVASFVDANSEGHVWRDVSFSSENILYPPTEKPSPSLTAAGLVPLSPNSETIPPATTAAPLLPASKRYVAGLRLAKTGQNFCGGVLISPLHVLTAANCVSDGKAEWVAVGSSASAGASDEILRVAQGGIVIHPKFGSPYMTSNNVAILTLEHAAYSSPIAFDTTPDFVDGTPATITGYGDLSGITSSETMKTVNYVALPVWSKRKCAAKIPNVDDSILCAGGEAGKDACTGDAGSPLTIQSISGEDLLVGIVSAGYGYGQEGVPGFYARTASLTEFIKAYTLATKWNSSASGKTSTETSATAPSASATAAAANENRSESSSSLVQLSKLTSVSQTKVLTFLIGPADHSNILGKELRARWSEELTSITLSSSEDLSTLTQIIEKHKALPLNRRADRFGTTAAAACSV